MSSREDSPDRHFIRSIYLLEILTLLGILILTMFPHLKYPGSALRAAVAEMTRLAKTENAYTNRDTKVAVGKLLGGA